jgi:hypothetical protein
MLGRYVAGTVLVLGVAMLMAPEPPERPPMPEVARAEPGALSLGGELPKPVPLATAERAREMFERRAAEAGGPSAGGAIDAAVAEAAAAAEPDRDAPLSGTVRLVVTGDRVNVRAGPSTRYEVISSLGYGERVELVSYSGRNWARIRLPQGDRVGFMARSFLVRDPAGG